VEAEEEEGEEEKSDEDIKDHEMHVEGKHQDMFGDIPTEFKMKTFLKIKHEMLCEYQEINSLSER
jgi:hypothetical protein